MLWEVTERNGGVRIIRHLIQWDVYGSLSNVASPSFHEEVTAGSVESDGNFFSILTLILHHLPLHDIVESWPKMDVSGAYLG